MTGSRPLTIAVDWFYSKESNYIVAMPIAMLLLAVTSVPVHREYYKSKSKFTCDQYVSSILIIILPMIIFLIANIIHGPNELISFIISILIIEKIGDEAGRLATYEKNLKKWVVSQTIRFHWFIPILFLTNNENKEFIQLIILSVAAIALSKILSELITESTTFNGRVGIANIKNNIGYLTGSLFSGIIRQLPRIYISKFHPNFAHGYILVGQVMQLSSLAYNAKYIIPSRKLQAKKSRRFYRYLKRVNKPIEFTAHVTFILGLLLTLSTDAQPYPLIVLFLSIEALLLLLISSISGLSMWTLTVREAFNLYLALSSIYCLTFCFIYWTDNTFQLKTHQITIVTVLLLYSLYQYQLVYFNKKNEL